MKHLLLAIVLGSLQLPIERISASLARDTPEQRANPTVEIFVLVEAASRPVGFRVTWSTTSTSLEPRRSCLRAIRWRDSDASVGSY
jgi:hypothetical protein